MANDATLTPALDADARRRKALEPVREAFGVRLVRELLALGMFRERWVIDGSVVSASFWSPRYDIAFVVSRNMDGAPYPWRCTRLDAAGEPFGHTYGRDASEAIANGADGWGEVNFISASRASCGVCGADDGTPFGCEHCQPADCTRAVAQYDGPADPDIDW